MPETFNSRSLALFDVLLQRVVGVVAILVAVAVAGCVEDAAAPSSSPAATINPTSAACPDVESRPCEPMDGPGNATGSEPLELVLVDCTAYVLLLDTTRQVFEPDYPDGVQGTHSVLMFASMTVYDCGQAGLPHRVIDGFQFAFFKTLVDPIEGVPGSSNPFFVHQVFASDADFAADVAATFGLDVVAMQPATITVEDLANGYQSFSLALPPEDPAYSVEGVMFRPGPEVERTDVLVYSAGDSLAYFTDDFAGVHANAGATTVFGPDSYWAQHGTTPAWSHLVAYRSDLSTTITFGGTV